VLKPLENLIKICFFYTIQPRLQLHNFEAKRAILYILIFNIFFKQFVVVITAINHFTIHGPTPHRKKIRAKKQICSLSSSVIHIHIWEKKYGNKCLLQKTSPLFFLILSKVNRKQWQVVFIKICLYMLCCVTL
jgi:hypothetical protein